jgi:uncharacterized protein (TIRG00374 family)
VFNIVTLVVGAVAFTFLVGRLGWSGIVDAVVGVGSWFIVMAAIDLASVFCDAGGVYCFVRPLAPISYFRVFAAQASGLAINRLTPGNSLGEPIKVTMLMAHVPEAAAVSSIMMLNFASYIVAMTAIVIGVPLTLLLLDLPSRAEVAVLIATAVMVGVVIGLIVLARRGAVATAIRAVRRIRGISAERAARWETRVAEIDANVRRFGDASTRRALVFVIASRLLNMAGSVVILVAVGIPLTAPLVIGTLSVGLLITWISNVIPLGLGVADGGNYVLYGVLGASRDAGLDFTMINRVRTCVLAAMGLTVMAIANLAERARRTES